LKSLLLRSPKVYKQKTFEGTLKGIWATGRHLRAKKSGNSSQFLFVAASSRYTLRRQVTEAQLEDRVLMVIL